MANDFKRKEPSKTEKVLYEIFMHQQHLEQNLITTSAHVVAMSMVIGVDPEKVAELLVNGNDKIKDYSDKINKAIDKLQLERKAKAGQTETSETPDEHAGHNHE